MKDAVLPRKDGIWFQRASQKSLPGLSCDEPKREGLGPIIKTVKSPERYKVLNNITG